MEHSASTPLMRLPRAAPRQTPQRQPPADDSPHFRGALTRSLPELRGSAVPELRAARRRPGTQTLHVSEDDAAVPTDVLSKSLRSRREPAHDRLLRATTTDPAARAQQRSIAEFGGAPSGEDVVELFARVAAASQGWGQPLAPGRECRRKVVCVPTKSLGTQGADGAPRCVPLMSSATLRRKTGAPLRNSADLVQLRALHPMLAKKVLRGEAHEPYNLLQVSDERAAAPVPEGAEVYSMTRTGLVQLAPGPAQVTPLEDWVWEAAAFRTLRASFKIFRYAREMRCLAHWRLATKRSIYDRLRARVGAKLLLEREAFRAPLLDVFSAAAAMRTTCMLDLSCVPERPDEAAGDVAETLAPPPLVEGVAREWMHLCPLTRTKKAAVKALKDAELGDADALAVSARGDDAAFRRAERRRLASVAESDSAQRRAIELPLFEKRQTKRQKAAAVHLEAALERVVQACASARNAAHTLVARDDASRQTALEQVALMKGVSVGEVQGKDQSMAAAREEAATRRTLRDAEREAKVMFGAFVRLADHVVVEALVQCGESAARSLRHRLDRARALKIGFFRVSVAFRDYEGCDRRGVRSSGALNVLNGCFEKQDDVKIRPATDLKQAWTAKSAGVCGEDVDASVSALDDEALERLSLDEAVAERLGATVSRSLGGTTFSPDSDEVREAAANVLHNAVHVLDGIPRLESMWPYGGDVSALRAYEQAFRGHTAAGADEADASKKGLADAEAVASRAVGRARRTEAKRNAKRLNRSDSSVASTSDSHTSDDGSSRGDASRRRDSRSGETSRSREMGPTTSCATSLASPTAEADGASLALRDDSSQVTPSRSTLLRQAQGGVADLVRRACESSVHFSNALLAIDGIIVDSFAKGDEYAASLDVLRSLFDAYAWQYENYATAESQVEARAARPECWRALAVAASLDAQLVHRDVERLRRWRLELNSSRPRGSCGAIECATRRLRQTLAGATRKFRGQIRANALNCARLHASAALRVAVRANLVLDEQPEELRNFARAAADVVLARAFAWPAVDALAGAALHLHKLLKSDALADDDFDAVVPGDDDDVFEPEIPKGAARSLDDVSAPALTASDVAAGRTDICVSLAQLEAQAGLRKFKVARHVAWRDGRLGGAHAQVDVEVAKVSKIVFVLARTLAGQRFVAAADDRYDDAWRMVEDLEPQRRKLDGVEETAAKLADLRGLLGVVAKEVQAIERGEGLQADGEGCDATGAAEGRTREVEDFPVEAVVWPHDAALAVDVACARVFFSRAELLWNMIARWRELHEGWLGQPLLHVDGDALDAESRLFARESAALVERLASPCHGDDAYDPQGQISETADGSGRTASLPPRGGGAAQRLLRETREFRSLVPVAIELKNPDLLSHHWAKLTRHVLASAAAPPDDDDADDALSFRPATTSLDDLLGCGISKHAAFVHTLGTAATAEAHIGSALRTLAGAWDSAQLPVVLFADEGNDGVPRAELGPLDDVRALASEHRAALKVIDCGDHGAALRPLILAWRRRLDVLLATLARAEELDVGLRALRPLIPDFGRVFKYATTRLIYTNRTWHDALEAISQDSRPLLLISDDGLMHDDVEGHPPSTRRLDGWVHDLRFLDELRFELRDYLAAKRAHFARFYFLSDAHLTQALGQLRVRFGSLAGVARAVPTLFPGVCAIEQSVPSADDDEASYASSEDADVAAFNAAEAQMPAAGASQRFAEATKAPRIGAVVDSCGERLVLRPVAVRGVPEEWLAALQREVRDALKAALTHVLRLQLRRRARDADHVVDESAGAPAQVRILAERVRWTGDISAALSSTIKHGDVSFLTECCALFHAIARQRAKDVRDYRAETVQSHCAALPGSSAAAPPRWRVVAEEALLMLAIQHAEAGDALQAEARDVTSLDDWAWQQHFRFYAITQAEAHDVVGFTAGSDRARRGSDAAHFASSLSAKIKARSEVGAISRLGPVVTAAVGGEYVGSTARCYLTPLAQRCVLAMLNALRSLNGVALLGPKAGGKAETVASLAGALGTAVVLRGSGAILNAADGSAVTLTRLFCGAAATGHILLFDVATDEAPKLLNAIAAHIDALSTAVRLKAASVNFSPLAPPVPFNKFRAEDDHWRDAMPLIVVKLSGDAHRNSDALLRGAAGRRLRAVALNTPDVKVLVHLELQRLGFAAQVAESAGFAISALVHCANALSLGVVFGLREGVKTAQHAALLLAGQQVLSLETAAERDSAVARFRVLYSESFVCQEARISEEARFRVLYAEARISEEARMRRSLLFAARLIFCINVHDADRAAILAIVDDVFPAEYADAAALTAEDEDSRRHRQRTAFFEAHRGPPTAAQTSAMASLGAAVDLGAAAIVAEAGAGKTACIDAVAGAAGKVILHTVAPASLPFDLCFGADGIAARLLRLSSRAADAEMPVERWIHLDGGVDSEALLLLLFDELAKAKPDPFADLAKGPASRRVRLVVETDALPDASPALLSRISIVHLASFGKQAAEDAGHASAVARAWFDRNLRVALEESGRGDVYDELDSLLAEMPLSNALNKARAYDALRGAASRDSSADDARRLNAMCTLAASLLDPNDNLDRSENQTAREAATLALAWGVAWGVFGHELCRAEAGDSSDCVAWLGTFFESDCDEVLLGQACAGLAPRPDLSGFVPWKHLAERAPAAPEPELLRDVVVPSDRFERACFQLRLLGRGGPRERAAPARALAMIEAAEPGVGASALARFFAARVVAGVDFRGQVATACVGAATTAEAVRATLMRRLAPSRALGDGARGGGLERRSARHLGRSAADDDLSADVERCTLFSPVGGSVAASAKLYVVIDDVSLGAAGGGGAAQLARAIAAHGGRCHVDLEQATNLAGATFGDDDQPVAVRQILGVDLIGVASSRRVEARCRAAFSPVSLARPSEADLAAIFVGVSRRALRCDAMDVELKLHAAAICGMTHLAARENLKAVTSVLHTLSRVARALALGLDGEKRLPLARLIAHELCRELRDAFQSTNVGSFKGGKTQFDELVRPAFSLDGGADAFANVREMLVEASPGGRCYDRRRRAASVVSVRVSSVVEAMNAARLLTAHPPVALPCHGSHHVARCARALAAHGVIVLAGERGSGRRSVAVAAAHHLGMAVVHAPPPPPPRDGAKLRLPHDDKRDDARTDARFALQPGGDAAWAAVFRKALFAAGAGEDVVVVVADDAWRSSAETAKRLDDVLAAIESGAVCDSTLFRGEDEAHIVQELAAAAMQAQAQKQAEESAMEDTFSADLKRPRLRRYTSPTETPAPPATHGSLEERAALDAFAAKVRAHLKLVVCCDGGDPVYAAESYARHASSAEAKECLKRLLRKATIDRIEFDDLESTAFNLLSPSSDGRTPSLAAWLSRPSVDVALQLPKRFKKKFELSQAEALLRGVGRAAQQLEEALPGPAKRALAKSCAEAYAVASRHVSVDPCSFRALVVAAATVAAWRSEALLSTSAFVDAGLCALTDAHGAAARLTSDAQKARKDAAIAFADSNAHAAACHDCVDGLELQEARKLESAPVKAQAYEARDLAIKAHDAAASATHAAVLAAVQAVRSISRDAMGSDEAPKPRFVRQCLEALALVMMDAAPSVEAGWARFTSGKSLSNALVIWLAVAPHAASGTPPPAARARRAAAGAESPSDRAAALLAKWSAAVAAAQGLVEPPETGAGHMRRKMGFDGKNVGAPCGNLARAMVAHWNALAGETTVSAFRTVCRAETDIISACRVEALDDDAILAAKACLKATVSAVGDRKKQGTDSNALAVAHEQMARAAAVRFQEFTATLTRWDGRAAALACSHAGLPASSALAAAAVTYGAQLSNAPSKAPPLLSARTPRQKRLDKATSPRWVLLDALNRTLLGSPLRRQDAAGLPVAFPPLCAAVTDEACDGGGGGDYGLPLRRWASQGLLQGGCGGDLAFAVAAANAPDGMRVPVLVDPDGDLSIWLDGVYDCTRGDSQLARIYLSADGSASLVEQSTGGLRRKQDDAPMHATPFCAALHEALKGGTYLAIVVELPDDLAGIGKVLSAAEPVLRARFEAQASPDALAAALDGLVGRDGSDDMPLEPRLKSPPKAMRSPIEPARRASDRAATPTRRASDRLATPKEEPPRSAARLFFRTSLRFDDAQNALQKQVSPSCFALLTMIDGASNDACGRLVTLCTVDADALREPKWRGTVAATLAAAAKARAAGLTLQEDEDALLEAAAGMDDLALAAIDDETPHVVAAARRRAASEKRFTMALDQALRAFRRRDALCLRFRPYCIAVADVIKACAADGGASGAFALKAHAARLMAWVMHHVDATGAVPTFEQDPAVVVEITRAAWYLVRPNVPSAETLPRLLAIAAATLEHRAQLATALDSSKESHRSVLSDKSTLDAVVRCSDPGPALALLAQADAAGGRRAAGTADAVVRSWLALDGAEALEASEAVEGAEAVEASAALWPPAAVRRELALLELDLGDLRGLCEDVASHAASWEELSLRGTFCEIVFGVQVCASDRAPPELAQKFFGDPAHVSRQRTLKRAPKAKAAGAAREAAKAAAADVVRQVGQTSKVESAVEAARGALEAATEDEDEEPGEPEPDAEPFSKLLLLRAFLGPTQLPKIARALAKAVLGIDADAKAHCCAPDVWPPRKPVVKEGVAAVKEASVDEFHEFRAFDDSTAASAAHFLCAAARAVSSAQPVLVRCSADVDFAEDALRGAAILFRDAANSESDAAPALLGPAILHVMLGAPAALDAAVAAMKRARASGEWVALIHCQLSPLDRIAAALEALKRSDFEHSATEAQKHRSATFRLFAFAFESHGSSGASVTRALERCCGARVRLEAAQGAGRMLAVALREGGGPHASPGLFEALDPEAQRALYAQCMLWVLLRTRREILPLTNSPANGHGGFGHAWIWALQVERPPFASVLALETPESAINALARQAWSLARPPALFAADCEARKRQGDSTHLSKVHDAEERHHALALEALARLAMARCDVRAPYKVVRRNASPSIPPAGAAALALKAAQRKDRREDGMASSDSESESTVADVEDPLAFLADPLADPWLAAPDAEMRHGLAGVLEFVDSLPTRRDADMVGLGDCFLEGFGSYLDGVETQRILNSDVFHRHRTPPQNAQHDAPLDDDALRRVLQAVRDRVARFETPLPIDARLEAATLDGTAVQSLAAAHEIPDGLASGEPSARAFEDVDETRPWSGWKEVRDRELRRLTSVCAAVRRDLDSGAATADVRRQRLPEAWGEMTKLHDSVGLFSWLDDLEARRHALECWPTGASGCVSLPPSVWVGGLFLPAAFFAALQRADASRDDAETASRGVRGAEALLCTAMDFGAHGVCAAPRSGAFVHGFSLLRARLDGRDVLEAASTARRVNVCLWVRCARDRRGKKKHVLDDLEPSAKPTEHFYECPVYSTADRGHFVTALKIRILEPTDDFVLRAAAMVCTDRGAAIFEGAAPAAATAPAAAAPREEL